MIFITQNVGDGSRLTPFGSSATVPDRLDFGVAVLHRELTLSTWYSGKENATHG
jgi:hypothetical protein